MRVDPPSEAHPNVNPEASTSATQAPRMCLSRTPAWVHGNYDHNEEDQCYTWWCWDNDDDEMMLMVVVGPQCSGGGGGRRCGGRSSSSSSSTSSSGSSSSGSGDGPVIVVVVAVVVEEEAVEVGRGGRRSQDFGASPSVAQD